MTNGKEDKALRCCSVLRSLISYLGDAVSYLGVAVSLLGVAVSYLGVAPCSLGVVQPLCAAYVPLMRRLCAAYVPLKCALVRHQKCVVLCSASSEKIPKFRREVYRSQL